MTWFDTAGTVAIVVAAWLFLYALMVVWVFVWRFVSLSVWLRRENSSVQALLSGADRPNFDSALYPCVRQSLGPTLMKACQESAAKDTTRLLTSLSAIASTAPFVGLFGTIVSILQAFAGFKEGVTLAIVAPAISEALVVTAMGIVVAIPAYWAHLLLRRKAYEVTNAIKIQIDILMSRV
ncbi:MAG: MotA/TolQ/ExbB proton channel family protein [Helicobacteraceae bacterium]|jgi:biopolymer transport protein ExbB/TolQ|nr:MotA/TolQ/ExbB proton channel family protein [Helicobacteraceae bacterium]